MKRLSLTLIFGLLIVSFCFAQIQTGNASYNASKTGFTISHSSLSFNTRVKVTNLRNNRSVEAVVNGRIPISADRIAEINRDAGDALEIDKKGMTLVQIEELPPRIAETTPAVSPPIASAPAETPVPAETPAAVPVPVPVPVPQQSAPTPSVITQTQVLPVQTVTDIQYVPVPAAAPGGPCCNAVLIWVIFFLLLLVIAILVVILVVLHRRMPLWPWYYPLWIRRRRRYLKKTRKRLR
jgi:rare lipoprotein A